MPYYVMGTDLAYCLRLRRDTLAGAEKKARELLAENYWDVQIEAPDGTVRAVEFRDPLSLV